MSGSSYVTEMNYFPKIQENNYQFKNFFELQKIVCHHNDKDIKIAKNIQLPTIVCSQLPSLIQTILQK